MLAFLIAAAVATTGAPTKAEPRGSQADWFRDQDLPQVKEAVSVTTFDLRLDEDGRPVGCEIVIESGSSRLDSAVCKTLVKRARFKPATDEQGDTVPSVYRDRVVWLPRGSGPNQWTKNPDVVISTPRLSQPLARVTEILVMFDSSGHGERCYVLETSGEAPLDKLACDAAKNPSVAPPISNESGEKVAGSRSLFVGFKQASETTLEIR